MKKLFVLLLIWFLFLPYLTFSQFKFQIEFQNSLAFPSLSDLNLYPETMNEYYKQLNDYSYFEENGQIQNLNQTHNMNFSGIKKPVAFLERLKLLINNHFSISAGIQYLNKTKISSSSLNISFTPNNPNRISDSKSEKLEMEVHAKMVMPNILFHFSTSKVLKNKNGFNITFEGFAGLGFIFGEVKTSLNDVVEINYKFIDSNKDYGLAYDLKTEQNGKGKGIGFLGGLRINFHISKKAGFFMGANYLYGKVKNIKGGGYRIYSPEPKGNYPYFDVQGDFQLWENEEWYVLSDKINILGELTDFEYPSNNPNLLDEKERDFSLDFSGLYINIGLFVKF